MKNIIVKNLLVTLLVSLGLNLFSQNKANASNDPSKKKKETKVTEVVSSTSDSIPAGEYFKRANNWLKAEKKDYEVKPGTASGSKIEFSATFLVKPKELNPEVDYNGKVTMNVLIECKDNRYKYTIYDIKHTSKTGKATGGSIDNIVPECGGMIMGEVPWKKLRGEALKLAGKVAKDIKDGMAIDSGSSQDDW